MASVVQCGRNKSSVGGMNPAEVNLEANFPVDLREATVLPASEWTRIQDSLRRVNKQRERLVAAARNREAQHLRSKEVVKNWPNTIAAQRQKKLEARRVREEIEEEKRKQLDLEEAKFQAQKRKEAIERAKTLLYYQTDRVKGFHGALLMTEVLKEREAQIELQKKKENVSKEVENGLLAKISRKEELALRQELQKAEERKQRRLENAEAVKQQIKKHEQAREKEEIERKKEAEELESFIVLHKKELTTQAQNKQEEKRNLLKEFQEQFANKKTNEVAEAEKEELEEERRNVVVKARDQVMKHMKETEADMVRALQRHREALADKLDAQRKQTYIEDELTSKAAAEFELKKDKQQREKDEKRAAMLKSIAEHRDAVQNEMECKKQEKKQKATETLTANKAADNIFLQKKRIKAQTMRETAKILENTYAQKMAEKHAQKQLMKHQELEFGTKNAELIAEEEKQFQDYAKEVIQKASGTQKNTSLLSKATKEGIGGALDLHTETNKNSENESRRASELLCVKQKQNVGEGSPSPPTTSNTKHLSL